MSDSELVPVTALPWKRLIHTIYAGSAPTTQIATGVRASDAAYIVHACNNYPALEAQVKVLREALERLLAPCEATTFSDQYPAECEGARTALSKVGEE